MLSEEGEKWGRGGEASYARSGSLLKMTRREFESLSPRNNIFSKDGKPKNLSLSFK